MADATTATNPKIEELRARLKIDPKSRHFYPLAEELRKIHQFDEAEQLLRDGLQAHSTYLSAWISLGRVLRDRSRDHEAVEVLKRALSLDPGNVVAAKLLAQAYLGVGDKVEAIKKFKLVFAMMPSDEEVEASIQQLANEIAAEGSPAPSVPVQPPAPPMIESVEESPLEAPRATSPFLADQLPAVEPEVSRFDATDPVPFGDDEEPFGSTSDMAISGLLSSPSSEGVPEADGPLDLAAGPITPVEATAQLGEPAEPFGVIDEIRAADAEPEPGGLEPEFSENLGGESVPSVPIPATMTMAHLYESQGHEEQAAELYKQILDQHPEHAEARLALSRAGGAVSADAVVSRDRKAVIKRLEQWRERVARS